MLLAIQTVFSAVSSVPPKPILHHFSGLAISLPILIITDSHPSFSKPLMPVILVHSPFFILQETYIY